MANRNLYLVRHATPDFPDGVKLCIGSTDIDIAEKGIEESERLREFFKEKEISHIFSSPLARCVHTAEIIADGIIEVEIDKGLTEIFMGSWEGIPLKKIKKELGDEPADGEPRLKALDRFEKSLNQIMKKTVGDVLCVAHAGVNCAFIAKITGHDIRTSRKIQQGYGCYNRFDFIREGSIEDRFRCIEIGIIPEAFDEKII